MPDAGLLLFVVEDVDLFVGRGELEALADFDFLLAGVSLQALDAGLLLLDFLVQLFVAYFEFMDLTTFVQETLNSIRSAQRDECVDNAAKYDQCVGSLTG